MSSLDLSFAKALDDLSPKVFIPALILSMIVEFSPWLEKVLGWGFVYIYLLISWVCLTFSYLFLYFVYWVGQRLWGAGNAGPSLGILLMPVGILCILPESFTGIDIAVSQISGVAILVWSFALMRGDKLIFNLLK